MSRILRKSMFLARHSYLLAFLLVGVFIGYHQNARAALTKAPASKAQPLDDAEIKCPDGKPPLKISSPPADPPPPNNAGTECDWYGTLEDRGNCGGANNDLNRRKLGGYNQTCRNMTNGAGKCAGAPDFDDYVNGMRYCLQSSSKTDLCDANGCLKNGLTCTDVVNDVAQAHNGCNAQQNFCGLSCGSFQCFGSAIGDAWGGWLIGTGNGGPVTPIGALNTTMQVLQCAPAQKITIVDCMCKGYQQSCMARYKGAEVGRNWKNWLNYLLCVGSCPRAPLVQKKVF